MINICIAVILRAWYLNGTWSHGVKEIGKVNTISIVLQLPGVDNFCQLAKKVESGTYKSLFCTKMNKKNNRKRWREDQKKSKKFLFRKSMILKSLELYKSKRAYSVWCSLKHLRISRRQLVELLMDRSIYIRISLIKKLWISFLLIKALSHT